MTKLLPALFLALATIGFAAFDMTGPMAYTALLTGFAFIAQGFIRPVTKRTARNIERNAR